MTIGERKIERLRAGLHDLYGQPAGDQALANLLLLLDRYLPEMPERRPATTYFGERDALLITYGDMVRSTSATPLATLAGFLDRYAAPLVNTVHLLPFFPASSDDGFSVIDYQAVDPALGSWSDIRRIGRNFRLMFDAVVNHISAQSAWFLAFLRDEPAFRRHFTLLPPETDLSAVFRPRSRPLLTPVATAGGLKHVWTTFSPDQIDLNYANPDVLLAVLDTLLFYVARGARLIRLDAIAFIWKEIGTSCVHLPQTHGVVQLMRTVLDIAAPQVALVTETNVPHAENISYFGDGANEAQMVYNFSLPPLVLDAFHTGRARTLSGWAAGLVTPSPDTTFLNFLASHDGIGLTPARGLLSEAAIDNLSGRTEALGGQVSYRSVGNGRQAAYELNINFLDALGQPGENPTDSELYARRFLSAQAIMLALKGVPGIYFHSLFGSRGWPEGVRQTGDKRTINRQKLAQAELATALVDHRSLRSQVYNGMARMLRARALTAAFHPAGAQNILRVHDSLFGVLRSSPDGRASVLCLQNVSGRPCQFSLSAADLGWARQGELQEMLTSRAVNMSAAGRLSLSLAPYEVRWLRPASQSEGRSPF